MLKYKKLWKLWSNSPKCDRARRYKRPTFRVAKCKILFCISSGIYNAMFYSLFFMLEEKRKINGAKSSTEKNSLMLRKHKKIGPFNTAIES